MSPQVAFQSDLSTWVSGTDPEYSMPLTVTPLPPEAIEILRRWIDQGASGPDDKSLAEKAYAMELSSCNAAKLTAWEQAIDRLLEQSLAKNNLTFSPEESKPQFIRRLYLVALGVPPTIDEVQQFVHDSDPLAVEKLVDRVLATLAMESGWHVTGSMLSGRKSHGFETNRVRYNAGPIAITLSTFNQIYPIISLFMIRSQGIPRGGFCNRLFSSWHL